MLSIWRDHPWTPRLAPPPLPLVAVDRTECGWVTHTFHFLPDFLKVAWVHQLGLRSSTYCCRLHLQTWGLIASSKHSLPAVTQSTAASPIASFSFLKSPITSPFVLLFPVRASAWLLSSFALGTACLHVQHACG